MIITITNPFNRQSVRFYSDGEWWSQYPHYDIYEPAVIDNNYLLIGNVGGLKYLPSNTTNVIKGIDQNGSTPLNNYYDDRIISFRFDEVDGVNLDYLNTTFFQNNHLLDIEVLMEDVRKYYTHGGLVGSLEGGNVELQCRPQFDLDMLLSPKYTIPYSKGGAPTLPIKLPSIVLKASNIDYNLINVNNSSQIIPSIEIAGHIIGLSIMNNNNGREFVVNGEYRNIKINNSTMRVIADGTDITDETIGMFPELQAGSTQFDINFQTQFEDVIVTISYNLQTWGAY